jgi:hypothetical protein
MSSDLAAVRQRQRRTAITGNFAATDVQAGDNSLAFLLAARVTITCSHSLPHRCAGKLLSL